MWVSQFVIMTTSRVGGPPHDPWPVLFWTLLMLAFLAVVGLAATIANHVEDRRHNPEARRRSREHDAPAA